MSNSSSLKTLTDSSPARTPGSFVGSDPENPIHESESEVENENSIEESLGAPEMIATNQYDNPICIQYSDISDMEVLSNNKGIRLKVTNVSANKLIKLRSKLMSELNNSPVPNSVSSATLRIFTNKTKN